MSTFALLALITAQPAAATDQGTPTVQEEGRGAQPFIEAGLLLYRKLRFQEARREFQKAVEAEPSNAAAHFYLGYTLYKIAEPTRRLTPEKVQAREEFARCFELDRSYRPTW
jgi:Flp pilus assembly protein TadD